MQRALREMPARTWEEIESVAEHVADMEVTIPDLRLMSNGGMLVSCVFPRAYARMALNAAIASKDKFVFLRTYTVERDNFAEGDDGPDNTDWTTDND